VSPENVLLSFDGRVCVADFGVAKFTDQDRRTRSGVVKGKFAYMSPEQTEAQELDRRSDVFSLGIVLHECLTGQPLFEGRSVPDTVRRIWSVVPADPTEQRADVPAAIVPIVMRCLEKDREQRYATAGELAQQLRALLRQSGAVIDEADVAQLLATHFPKGREKFRQRVRTARQEADGTADERLDGLPPPPGEGQDGGEPFEGYAEERGSARGSVAASVTTGPPLHSRRLSAPLALLGAALLIGLIVFVLQTGDESAPAPSVATTDTPASSATAPGASSSAAAAPDEEARAVPDAAVEEPAAGLVSPPAPPRPTLPPTRPAAPRLTSRPAPSTPTAEPATTSTPSSHKGVPFQSLDP
jgi:serine/threonine-protein kinase